MTWADVFYVLATLWIACGLWAWAELFVAWGWETVPLLVCAPIVGPIGLCINRMDVHK